MDDAEVRPALEALFFDHHDRRFLGRRFEGMRLVEGLKERGDLDF